jgi:signal transduction histidine kinase/ligand-binding sensor domain-containing protein/CheY-like chemotaxis protein/HPt (histidine-containing phosphotransfer) domain-containing protein
MSHSGVPVPDSLEYVRAGASGASGRKLSGRTFPAETDGRLRELHRDLRGLKLEFRMCIKRGSAEIVHGMQMRGKHLRQSILTGFIGVLKVTAVLAADSPALILDHLTPSDGMPQGTVMSTLQDSQGFIWLATEDGLVRYDGHELVRYAYARNVANSLPGNFIYQIAEDDHRDLWLAVKDAGVARWNRATDSFTVFRHDPANDHSLGSDATRAVLVDKNGYVWVGTSGAGLDVIDQRTGAVKHMRHDPEKPATLGDDQVLTLDMDRNGTLWVGTSAGLDQWRPTDHSFVHYRADAGKLGSLTGARVSQVFTDESQHTWVGTLDGGLDMLDVTGRVVAAYRHDPAIASSLSSDEVRAVLQDRAGRLWIGTRDGLDLFDAATGGFRHYRHEESDSGSLRDSYIMSLYQDTADLLWIGTRQGGVGRWNPHSWELGGHRPAWLVGKLVTSFADAHAGRVWVGSLGGGLVRFDDRSGEAEDIDKVLGKPNVLGDRRVMSLLADHNDNLWIGMMTAGIKRLAKNGELVSITAKPGDPRGLSAGGIMSMYEAQNGNVWIGTFGGGVNVYEVATGVVRQLPFAADAAGATSSNTITAIAEDDRGYIWLGTGGGGLDIARPDGTVFKIFKNDPNVTSSLPSNTIYGITVDKKHQIWIATDKGGIARILGSPDRPDEIKFDVKSREDGLSSDTIYAVIPEDSGKLWMSGNAGLLRLDPADGRIKSFHREHGLQGEEFDFNASLKLPDGRLCFGGPGGFNLFDPAMLEDNGHAPRVVLTRIEVLGAPFHSATPFWLLNRVALDYNASIVSFDFAALDFTSPKRNRLAYRIAGLSDRWIDLGTQHRITLTDPDSGDHLLEVRAANADSMWSEPLTLIVHREPPPWRSTSAYVLYGLIVLLLIGSRLRVTRARLARVVRAKESLESQVAVRTRELIESNRQLEDASRAKSNFLARVSHELRTPMNGVVGSTELLARTAQSPKQKRLTDTIQSSAAVLLQIVNDLLDLSKMQEGKIQLESLPLNLEQILEESTMLFAAAAEAKGIELIVCPPEVSVPLRGDPLRIRQILMNLIGNAVKFTSKGEVAVKADISAVGSETAVLEMTVTDTGIGMDPATIGKIFEPFTQADESTTRRFGGSGLGLAICREIAERMGGKIQAESSPNIGSVFRVSLPLRCSQDVSNVDQSSSRGAQIRILSRRRSLREALVRQVTMIGYKVAAEDGADSQSAATASATVVDLGTHESYVLKQATADAGSNAPLVIVATTAEFDRLREKCDPGAVWFVPKPVQRLCLDEALTAALSGAEPKPAESRSLAQYQPIQGHVLIVEDEPVNAQVAQAYVHELGCTSTWVTNGSEAVARCMGEQFDLVLMDLSMPGMDGHATTKLIRQHEAGKRRLPIVALTAHDGARHRAECVASGMDDLLCKPYTLAQCAELLRAWIKKPGGSKRRASLKPPLVADSAVNTRLSIVDAQSVAGLRHLQGPGNEDLYARLVRIFHDSSRDAVTQLELTLARADYTAAGAVCHKLAAAAANVGALIFAREVRRLEQACAYNDQDAARQIMTQLKAALPALYLELSNNQIPVSA